MLTGVDSVDDPWELIKDPLSLERLDLARSNPSDRERCLKRLEHCEREGAGAGAGSTVATCIQCRGPLELAHQIARSATPFSDYVFLSMKSRIIRRLEASHFSIIEVDSDFKATALLSQPSSSAALRLEERSCSYNSLHSTTANCSSRPVTVDAKVKFFLHMNSEGFIVKSVSYLI
eukprot:gene7679-8486_t